MSKKRKVPKLTKEQQEKLRQYRATFNSIHDLFEEENVIETEGKIATFSAEMQSKFQDLSKKITLSDLPMTEHQGLSDLLKDYTLEECQVFLERFQNALQVEQKNQFVDKRVKELGIKLIRE